MIEKRLVFSAFLAGALLACTGALTLAAEPATAASTAAESAAAESAAARPAGAQPTVLITGANRGIGLAMAKHYAERGWNVVATARKPAEAEDLEAISAAHPGKVTIETLDVTDFAQIDALAAKYREKPIDILVNNAGISAPISAQLFGKMDYDAFRRVLEVNTIGPMKLTEAMMPSVLASEQKKVITISSSEGSFGKLSAGRLYWYRASKAAVNMLMLNLAYNVKGRGVAVACINPGPVDTDFMKGVKMPLQDPDLAVDRVVAVIDKVNIENTGKFFDYLGGEVPW